MTWDGADAEGTARWIYDLAEADMTSPGNPVTLAKAVGVEVLPAPRRGLWGDATLTKVGGRPVIWTAPRVPAVRLRFAVAHELAEWAMRARGNDDIEDLCNATAAAVLVPAGVFREALAAFGADLPALSRVFKVTETCAALRIGETTAEPIALVSPQLVRVRGDEWGWPSADEIRRLSRSKADPLALRLVRLTDDDRRVFLRVA